MPQFIQGVIFDVTKQKEAEGALQASEARFREMLENVRLAAVVMRPRGPHHLLQRVPGRAVGLVGGRADRPLWRETFTPPDELELEQRAQRGRRSRDR